MSMASAKLGRQCIAQLTSVHCRSTGSISLTGSRNASQSQRSVRQAGKRVVKSSSATKGGGKAVRLQRELDEALKDKDFLRCAALQAELDILPGAAAAAVTHASPEVSKQKLADIAAAAEARARAMEQLKSSQNAPWATTLQAVNAMFASDTKFSEKDVAMADVD